MRTIQQSSVSVANYKWRLMTTSTQSTVSNAWLSNRLNSMFIVIQKANPHTTVIVHGMLPVRCIYIALSAKELKVKRLPVNRYTSKRKRFERLINVLVFNLKSNEMNLFESDIYVLNSYLFPTFVRTILTVWCLRDSYLYGCLSKLTHQNNDTLFKQQRESRDKRKK